MHLQPREIDKLLLHGAGIAGPEAPRPRPPAQLPRGRRADRDAAARADPRRPRRRRADGPGAPHPRPRAGDGRRAGDAPRGAGRGHLRRRDEARDRAPPDRARSRRSRARAVRELPPRPGPGAFTLPPRERRSPARSHIAPGEIELDRGPPAPDARRDQPRRPADPGRQPLPLRRDERRARLRPRGGGGDAPRHPGRDRRPLRAGRVADGDARRRLRRSPPTGRAVER